MGRGTLRAPPPGSLVSRMAPTCSDALTEPDWDVLGARCRESDPLSFYPENGHNAAEAKSVCRGCPARAECLAYAVATDEQYGIWGGQSPSQRRPAVRAYKAIHR